VGLFSGGKERYMEACLTYQAILSELSLTYNDYSGGNNARIRNVELFEKGANTYSADTLYIAMGEDLRALQSEERLSFICCGTLPDADFTKRNNIAYVSTEITLQELANAVYATYIRLTNWINALAQSTLAKQGVQALLDRSETIFKNTITVLDSSLKLLAYTHNSLPNDAANIFLIENGYHSADTLEKFEKHNRFRESENIQDVIVSVDRAISDFVTVKYFFKHFNEVSVHVVMLCNHREASDGLTDLFKILVAFMELYVEKGYPYDGKYSAFDSLMHDLLDSHLSDIEEIKQRGNAAGIPFNGLFDIYKIDISDTAAQSLAYLSIHLAGMIPSSRVSFYKNSIVVFNVYPERGRAAAQLELVESILRKVAIKSIDAVGVSNVFCSLSEFYTAYWQAEGALSVSKLKAEKAHSGTESFIYRFEDCYLTHILSHVYGDDLYKNSMAEQIHAKLLEYCRERNYDYLTVLQEYLLHERRISEVAEILHLHRNTVIYHVDRLEKHLGVSFDDPMLRIKLLMEIFKHKLGEKE